MIRVNPRLLSSKKLNSDNDDINNDDSKNILVIKNYLKEDIVKINTNYNLLNKIDKKNFIRLPDNIVPKLDAVVRELPQVADNISNHNVYEVIYDKGLGNLQKSSQYPGYYLGGLVEKGSNNKYTGAALLKPISNVQQIAGATFSVLSVATGQYYMEQINKKLSGILSDVVYIKDFLNDEKRSDLESYEHYFLGVVNNLEVIHNNSIYRQSVLSQLLNIQNKLYSSIQLYSKQITRHKNSVSSKDKIDEIAKKIQDLSELVSSYKYSIMLYMYSKLLELLVSMVMDKEYINSIIIDLDNLEEIHQNNFESWNEIYNKYLSDAKVFKDNEIVKALSKLKSTNIISTNLWILLGSKLVGYSADYFYNISKEKKENIKGEQLDAIEEFFTKNNNSLKKYISYIKDYNLLCNNPISIIRDEEGIYLNIKENNK